MRRRTLLTALGVALHGAAARAVGERPVTVAPPPRSLLRLAGSCILAGYRHDRLPGELTSMLADGALGGVILAQENVSDASQLRWVTSQLRLLTPPGNPPPLIAADQEGGPVSHLSPPLVSLPSLTSLGRIDDVALTRRVGVALGQSLMDVGVNFDLAPVLDVRTNRANNVVLGRVFGDDPQRVARHAVPFIEGLRSTGILACAKHFPGHGDTREDSHRGLPRVPHAVERLDAVELVPFRAASSVVPAVMVAHVVYEGVDRLRPATLSRACAHELLRDHVGFEGVSVSDDLEMTPIRVDYGVAAGAVQSMAAGCDLLTIAHTPGHARNAARAMAARAAVDEGFLARLEEAAARVRRMRELLTIPVPVRARREDVTALLREVRSRADDAARRYRDPTRGG